MVILCIRVCVMGGVGSWNDADDERAVVYMSGSLFVGSLLPRFFLTGNSVLATWLAYFLDFFRYCGVSDINFCL